VDRPVAPFLGRADELHLLHSSLARAANGGGVVLLGGEPGIGKTRIVQEFAAAAEAQGATVLWGHCLEGEWTPPYGPWVEALTAYLRTFSRARLRGEFDADGPALVRILPALRALLPDLPIAVSLSLDDERLRLYDAVTRLLQRAGAHAPVVLALDDLHWADRDSLELLRHALRTADRSRLLIVGTYRTTALSPRHPLQDVLAAAVRQPQSVQVTVDGLSRADVTRLLTAMAGKDVPPSLIQSIYAETDGARPQPPGAGGDGRKRTARSAERASGGEPSV
jgi:predicted ATPase